MTLINYLARVHFGEGVLEEAMRAEMEARRRVRPLIVAESADLSSGVSDRLFLSLPSRLRCELYSEIPLIPSVAETGRLAEEYRSRNCDLLVAYGGRASIELAKLARIAIARGKGAAPSARAPPAPQDGNDDQIPDLFAVPSIEALTAPFIMQAGVNASWPGRSMLAKRAYLPTVVFLDPTLYAGASEQQAACALAEAVTCCAEAYLAPEFNPPADGIAMDGLARAFGVISRLPGKDGLASCREIVAAGLDAGLALQKGAGLTQIMSGALRAALDKPVSEGGLNRILLDGALKIALDAADGKESRLNMLLGVSPERGFGDFVSGMFEKLPVPNRLGELGVEAGHLDLAAQTAASELSAGVNAYRTGAEDLLGIMRAAL